MTPIQYDIIFIILIHKTVINQQYILSLTSELRLASKENEVLPASIVINVTTHIKPPGQSEAGLCGETGPDSRYSTQQVTSTNRSHQSHQSAFKQYLYHTKHFTLSCMYHFWVKSFAFIQRECWINTLSVWSGHYLKCFLYVNSLSCEVKHAFP